jgi:hypothetical protein
MIDFEYPGRMLSLSKSHYRSNYPNNKVVFNANVFTKERGKVWHGDLDLTVEISELQRLAATFNEEVWVLREMDGRFDNAKQPNWDRFVVRVSPEGSIIHAKLEI